MGFLDRLLGRSKQMAGEAAGKSKEMAGEAKEKAEGMMHGSGHEHGDGGHEHDEGESGGGTAPPSA